MNMTKSCQKQRLKGRHGVGDDEDSDIGKEIQEGLERLYDSYEPAGEDEEGAYNVNITEDMTREDVLKQVIDIMAKIWKIAFFVLGQIKNEIRMERKLVIPPRNALPYDTIELPYYSLIW